MTNEEKIELLKMTTVLQNILLRKHGLVKEANMFHHGLMFVLTGNSRERFKKAKKILEITDEDSSIKIEKDNTYQEIIDFDKEIK